MNTIPAPSQLLMPLLQEIEQAGKTTPKEMYGQLANILELSPEARSETLTIHNGKTFSLWERNVRLAKQAAVFKGLMPSPAETPKGNWELTPQGKERLQNALPGTVVTLFTNDHNIVLWAEAEAAVKTIEDDLIQAIITSPPYPILRKKEYEGQLEENDHVAWLYDFFAASKRTLTPTGSIALNLGPAWKKGTPTQSLYAEKLVLQLCERAGYHLAQKLYWHNPSKLPSPAEWVTIRRVRVTPAIEEIYWLSKTPNPKADNRNVLRQYSQAMKSRLAQGGEATTRTKPSGHALKEGAFGKDNGGAIAHSLLQIPHCRSNDPYLQHCRASNHKAHPARFPGELVDWLIDLLTDPGDVIWDPFGGSLTTAASAQKKNRLCLSSELNLNYALDGIHGRLQTP